MNKLRHWLAVAALSACASAASAGSYSGLYVFGDSLSDPGNLALAIGSNPGQVITGNGYIPDAPYASGQFSNGDVWARTYAGLIGLGAYGQPFQLGGGNFAYGGARVVTDGAGLPPSLKTQESFFLGATGGTAPSGALYVIEGGGNDARDALAAAAVSADPFGVIASAAAAYAQGIGLLVDQLHTAGAQHLVVWNVPDLSLAPAVTTLGAGATFLAGQVSMAMNSALVARLGASSGVTLFDLFGLEESFVANPSAYGLSNVTDACGAPTAGCDPTTSLFWDGIHPTSAGHALLAQEMFVATVPEPAEYLLMIGGLLFVARRFARVRRDG